jgi:selenocysteine-specific elongation factor
LQVHGRNVNEAYAGQRVAVNIPGIETDRLRRGDVLITPGSLPVTRRLDARLTLLRDADKAMKNRARVRFYLGAAELMARVVLLDRDALAPGESTYAQIQLEAETVAAYGDNFIIRSYSPMRTIGGGRVLNPEAPRHKRFRPETLSSLATLEQGTPQQLVREYLLRVDRPVPVDEIAQSMGWSAQRVYEVGKELTFLGRAKVLTVDGREYLVADALLEAWGRKIREVTARYHKDYPLREGYPREELRSRFFAELNAKLFNSLLGLLAEEGLVELKGRVVALPGFHPEPSQEQKAIIDRILAAFRDGGLQPPSWESVSETLGLEGMAAGELQNYLLRTGQLVRVSEELIFHPENS